MGVYRSQMPGYATELCREARTVLAAHPDGLACPVCGAPGQCPPRLAALEQHARYRLLAAAGPVHPNQAPATATAEQPRPHQGNILHARAVIAPACTSRRNSRRPW